MEICLLTILIILNGILICITAFSKRKGENAADIEDNRKKHYEAEKGKNLATKEDVEEITKKIESIRAEVSYENLRKHNAIQEREHRFLNILHIAESVQKNQVMVFFSMHQVDNVLTMTNIIKELNDLAVELNHEYRLIITSYKNTTDLENLTKLVKSLQLYSTEICVAATNAASIMSSWRTYMDMYMQSGSDGTRSSFLELAATNKSNLDKYCEKLCFSEKDNVANYISDYVVFLRRLFNVEFNINYEIPELKPVSSCNPNINQKYNDDNSDSR